MPYQIVPVFDGFYKVVNRLTGKIHSYHATLDNAEKQVKLMNMADHRSGIEKKKVVKKHGNTNK